LSYQTAPDELESLFSEVGVVVNVSVPANRDTGRPRGFAFVEFADEAAAKKAIEKFDGYELQSRRIRVNQAERTQERSCSFTDARRQSGDYQGPRGSKQKGSRRNIRAGKREF
jgi:RNA recognition motif-containing protein